MGAKKKPKSTKQKKEFWSITVHKDLIPKLREAHARYAPKYTVNGFYEDMLEVYIKAHCPECLSTLSPKTCSCKATERM